MRGLGYGFRITVPSTTRIFHKVKPKTFSKRVGFTERKMSNLFGGETTQFGFGSYQTKIRGRQRTVRERVGLVKSFTSKKGFFSGSKKVRNLARLEAKRFRQESISVESFSPRGRRLAFVTAH